MLKKTHTYDICHSRIKVWLHWFGKCSCLVTSHQPRCMMFTHDWKIIWLVKMSIRSYLRTPSCFATKLLFWGRARLSRHFKKFFKRHRFGLSHCKWLRSSFQNIFTRTCFETDQSFVLVLELI